MGRKPFKAAAEKQQIVLSVRRGEMAQVEAGRRLQMSQTTIAKWQKQFLEGGHEALSRGENAKGSSTRWEDELEGQVQELQEALGEAYVEQGLAQERVSTAFEILETIRVEARLPVRRFCSRLQIPRSTWYYRRRSHREGRTVKRWPAPVVDRIEEVAADAARAHSAWGHRKIAAMIKADG